MTSKMLVAFDPAKPDRASSDFLVPIISDGKVVLFGTGSKQVTRYGMVIYVGKRIVANDLFARLVDSGHKVPVVNEALSLISAYIDKFDSLKIGQVVEIAGTDTESGVALKLAAYPKAVKTPRLP